MSAKSPRRAAPSWFPDVRMTVVSAVSSRRARRIRARASRGGTARSNTSPEMSTVSTPRSRTRATNHSMNASALSPRDAPCSVRPRCQSEVCRINMLPV